MPENKLHFPEVSQKAAQTRIEEIFEDIYGGDGYASLMVGGTPVIRAHGFADEVEIRTRNQGALVDVADSQSTTISRIKSRLGDSGMQELGGKDEVMEESRKMRESLETAESLEANGGNAFKKAHPDGAITFMPMFNKDEADYHGPGGGENPELDCKDCAHYIEGGGCHVVQGEVDPDGHCENFYADAGLFMRLDPRHGFRTNLKLWGERLKNKVREFFTDLEEASEAAGEEVEGVVINYVETFRSD